MRELILDRSHFSGTDLDRDIVAYAEYNYLYRSLEPPADMDDSEGWQWEADEAIMWMNATLEHDGKYYMIEDNCLFLVTGEEDEDDA